MDVGRLEVIFPANVLEVTCGIWANQSDRLFETPDYEMLLRFVLAHASTSSTQGLVNVLLGHDAPSLQLKLEVMREEAAAGRSGWMTHLKALLTEATGSLWLEAALLAIKHEAGAELDLVGVAERVVEYPNSATHRIAQYPASRRTEPAYCRACCRASSLMRRQWMLPTQRNG